MADGKAFRLEIGGRDVTGECDNVEIGMPCLVYDVPHSEGAMRRVVGPKGFTITITNPSEQLRALVDGGYAIRTLRYVVHGQAVQVPTVFHEEWVEPSGVRKMFGCMYSDRDREPKWVDEPQLADA